MEFVKLSVLILKLKITMILFLIAFRDSDRSDEVGAAITRLHREPARKSAVNPRRNSYVSGNPLASEAIWDHPSRSSLSLHSLAQAPIN